jgi:hypothetical protein
VFPNGETRTRTGDNSISGGCRQVSNAHESPASARVPAISAGSLVVCYVAVPSYSDVLVLAATGVGTVRPWATMQASADAAGWVLLAHREAWQSSLRRVDPALALDDEAAAGIIERGYAERVARGAHCPSLAVAVPADSTPIAALAVRGPAALTESRQELVAFLERMAERLEPEGRSRQDDDYPRTGERARARWSRSACRRPGPAGLGHEGRRRRCQGPANGADVMLEPGRSSLDDVLLATDWGLPLAPAETALTSRESRRATADEFILRRQLQRLDARDVAVIDCPPSLGLLTINALPRPRG